MQNALVCNYISVLRCKRPKSFLKSNIWIPFFNFIATRVGFKAVGLFLILNPFNVTNKVAKNVENHWSKALEITFFSRFPEDQSIYDCDCQMNTLGRLYFDAFLIFNIFPFRFYVRVIFFSTIQAYFLDSTYLFFWIVFLGVTCPYCTGSQPVCRDTQVCPDITKSLIMS